MKYFLIALTLGIGVILGVVGEATSITRSCNDKEVTKTVILGQSYFCDDYDHARNLFETLAALAHANNQRRNGA